LLLLLLLFRWVSTVIEPLVRANLTHFCLRDVLVRAFFDRQMLQKATKNESAFEGVYVETIDLCLTFN
jgi:hypothetical protein